MVDLRVGKKGLRWAGHWEDSRDAMTADKQVSNWVALKTNWRIAQKACLRADASLRMGRIYE
jgi:hypothetical protein